MHSRRGDSIKLDLTDIKNVALSYLEFTEKYHEYGYTNKDAIEELLKNVRGHISKVSHYQALLDLVLHLRNESLRAEQLRSNVANWVTSWVKKTECGYTKKELNALASMILSLREYCEEFKVACNDEITQLNRKLALKESEKVSATQSYHGEIVRALNEEIKDIIVKGAMLSDIAFIEKAHSANYLTQDYSQDASLENYLSNATTKPIGSLLLYDFFGIDFYETLAADRTKSHLFSQTPPRYFDDFVDQSAKLRSPRIHSVTPNDPIYHTEETSKSSPNANVYPSTAGMFGSSKQVERTEQTQVSTQRPGKNKQNR